jgi:hypothetical protein
MEVLQARALGGRLLGLYVRPRLARLTQIDDGGEAELLISGIAASGSTAPAQATVVSTWA